MSETWCVCDEEVLSSLCSIKLTELSYKFVRTLMLQQQARRQKEDMIQRQLGHADKSALPVLTLSGREAGQRLI